IPRGWLPHSRRCKTGLWPPHGGKIILDTLMITSSRFLAFGLLLLALGTVPCRAVELKVSRDALQHTLKQQLFSGPDGRYFLKGNARSACAVFADDAQLNTRGPDDFLA